MREVVLGTKDSFAAFPAEIEIGRDWYYLTKLDDESYRLMSRICPHAGYMVEADGAGFYCDAHGWSFDGQTGKCTNSWGKLTSWEVVVRDGSLIVELP